ncbi:MAG: SDR family NAD(P)-dependent oxidoreductase [Candidatus Dormibacteria bacterium]
MSATERRLEGRVAIVTGAGRGLGRAHALFLAGQGADVVVNDLGGSVHGEGSDVSPAQQVVEEIEAMGSRAVASAHDVADWQQAADLVRMAVDNFGDLHVLVNNAGILRDRSLANMSEEEWDAVIRVHLKGHAATSRHAVAYWRDRSRAGHQVKASVVHTSSVAGYAGNFGQANYSSVKLAVVALSRVISLEGGRHGVRSNVVSPGARTRLSEAVPADLAVPPAPENGWDPFDPGNVSPLVGWLAAPDCPADSQVFHISGNQLLVLSMPPIVHRLRTEERWTLKELDSQLPSRLVKPLELAEFFEPEAPAED